MSDKTKEEKDYDKYIRDLRKDAVDSVYLYAGDDAALFGEGWYHYSTPADEVFVGHYGERDIFIIDFGIELDGSHNTFGTDIFFDVETGPRLGNYSRDGIAYLNHVSDNYTGRPETTGEFYTAWYDYDRDYEGVVSQFVWHGYVADPTWSSPMIRGEYMGNIQIYNNLVTPLP